MAEIGNTEISAVTASLVASLVQETLKQRGILLPTVSDFSAMAPAGATEVKVPRRDQFAAADKSENNDLVAQEMTFSSDIIDLSKHKAVYAKLEDFARIEATPNVEAEVIQEMAAEIALQVDKDILTELRLASAAGPDHRIQFANTPTDTAQQTDILELRRLLNLAKVPMSDRTLVISPDQEKSMLLISDFVRAESYGDPSGLREAELGRIYGFTVLMHTELAAAEMIAYHKSAVGYAAQAEVKFERDRELRSLSDEFAISTKYGVKVLDTGKRQVVMNATGL